MAPPAASVPPSPQSVPTDIAYLAASFERSLRAEGKSPKTIRSYMDSIALLRAFMMDRAMPTNIMAFTREHLESFTIDQGQRWKPATALNRYSGLRAFFKWAEEEGEIGKSPMGRMKPPKVPLDPVPVLSDHKIRTLLNCTGGRTFDDRRDHGILRVFLDTGARLSEVATLALADVGLDMRTVTVHGKGGRIRHLPIGVKTVKALDRYLRLRPSHPASHADRLWIGARGQMTDSGIAQMLRRRCRESGIDEINPHRFRHTFAHSWLANGGNEGDLMRLTGWRTRENASALRRLHSRRKGARSSRQVVTLRPILKASLWSKRLAHNNGKPLLWHCSTRSDPRHHFASEAPGEAVTHIGGFSSALLMRSASCANARKIRSSSSQAATLSI